MVDQGFTEFVDEVELSLPLSSSFKGEEKDINIVHLLITAKRSVYPLNCCFFSREHPFGIQPIDISRSLFSGPSKRCQKLFADVLRTTFHFQADPSTIQLWKAGSVYVLHYFDYLYINSREIVLR